MIGIENKLGYNAGKIWSVLDKKGSLKKKDIKKITKLTDVDFHSGIGWLARENKISIHDEDYYKLDKTNLVSKIGKNAGLLWRILDIWEEADLEVIKNLSALDKNKIYEAIGWLAREDKIIRNKNKYSLKY